MIATTKGKGKKAKPAVEPTGKAETKPKKPPKPAPTTAELKERWVNEIIKAQKEADRLGSIHSEADADARSAKKDHQAAVNRLQGLIRRGPSMQLELDLKPVESPANGQPAANQEQIDADWRKRMENTLCKEVLPLSEKQTAKLIEIGCPNLWKFEELRAGKIDGYPKGLRSISGWGDVMVTKLENAMEVWYAQNSPKKPDAKADAASTPVADASSKLKA